MKLLPDVITRIQRTASPEMMLLGVHVGYGAGGVAASPKEIALCRAVVNALIAAAGAGGYPQPDKLHMLLVLIKTPYPIKAVKEMCDCITPKAWEIAMQRPDFESICKIL